MKKYKLIKEYPGSPKIGSECTQLENDTITAYPEYWEEVKEKEYEILSIKKHRKLDNVKSFDEWTPSQKYSISLDAMLNLGVSVASGDYYINSVKRLSDGEVFTVGDKIIHFYPDQFGKIITKSYIIEKINFLKDGVSFYVGLGLNLGIKNIKKNKEVEVLFITEDGVKIHENDTFWCLNILNYNFWKSTCRANTQLHRDYRAFSTEKAGLNYIKCNKTVLSYSDVLSLYDRLSHCHIRHVYKNELQKLVDSKIK